MAHPRSKAWTTQGRIHTLDDKTLSLWEPSGRDFEKGSGGGSLKLLGSLMDVQSFCLHEHKEGQAQEQVDELLSYGALALSSYTDRTPVIRLNLARHGLELRCCTL